MHACMPVDIYLDVCIHACIPVSTHACNIYIVPFCVCVGAGMCGGRQTDCIYNKAAVS